MAVTTYNRHYANARLQLRTTKNVSEDNSAVDRAVQASRVMGSLKAPPRGQGGRRPEILSASKRQSPQPCPGGVAFRQNRLPDRWHVR